MTEGVSSHLHQERDRERGCDRIGALWRHRPFAHPSPPRLFGFSPQKDPPSHSGAPAPHRGSLFFSSPRARKKNARHILAEMQPHRAALWTTHPLENLTIPSQTPQAHTQANQEMRLRHTKHSRNPPAPAQNTYTNDKQFNQKIEKTVRNSAQLPSKSLTRPHLWRECRASASWSCIQDG